MINPSLLREADNDSRNRNLKGIERKRVIKTKTNALGDVQNTLHSRPVSFINQNTNPAKSVQRKPRVSVSAGDENKFATTGSKSATKNFGSQTPTDSDFHDHFLCEQADEAYLEKLHSEFKLTETQIDALVKSVKKFTLEKPLSVLCLDPLEDIEIPEEIMKDERDYDILGDFILPEVPAPVLELEA